MKVYVDNNVISAKAKKEFPDEIAALFELLKMFENGELELVTSEVTLREIEPYQGDAKGDMMKLYASLSKVPFIEDHIVKDFHSAWGPQGGCSYPLVEDHPVSSRIRKILPQKNKTRSRIDAHHLTVAIEGKCDIFITCDRKTILNYREQIENNNAIRIMKPSQLLKELTTNQLTHESLPIDISSVRK